MERKIYPIQEVAEVEKDVLMHSAEVASGEHDENQEVTGGFIIEGELVRPVVPGSLGDSSSSNSTSDLDSDDEPLQTPLSTPLPTPTPTTPSSPPVSVKEEVISEPEVRKRNPRAVHWEITSPPSPVARDRQVRVRSPVPSLIPPLPVPIGNAGAFSWWDIVQLIVTKMKFTSFDVLFKILLLMLLALIAWSNLFPVAPSSHRSEEAASVSSSWLGALKFSSPPPPPPPPSTPLIAPSPHSPPVDSVGMNQLLEAVYKDRGLFGTNPAETIVQVQRLEFIKSAKHFVRGYARMKHVCTEISKLIGLESMAQIHGHEGAHFNSSLYLTSAGVYGPYFCLNMPTFILTEKAFAPDAALHALSTNSHQSLELWRGMQIEWSRAISTGLLATHTIKETDLFAQSPLHTRLLVLYFERAFYARDLERLGKDYKPALAMQIVTYDAFVNQEALELQKPISSMDGIESIDKPRCICGPHLNMARHIVLYMDRHNPGGRLFIEPVITSHKGVTTLLDVAVLPWVATKVRGGGSGGGEGDDSKYHAVDLDLRREVGLTKLQCSKEVVIDGVKLARLSPMEARALETSLGTSAGHHFYQTTTKGHSFYNQGERRVDNILSGPEAQCIQYCEALAYAVRNRAAMLPDTERILP